MVLARAAITTLSLLLKGEWREIYIRTLIALGVLDVGTVFVEELNLSPERCHPYSDSGRDDLRALLSSLDIRRNDAIIDLGCGKGGTLISLTDYPFSKITGLDISQELIDIAKKNLAILKIDNVSVVHGDAEYFTDFEDYNYIYMFNPFPCSVVKGAIDNLASSLERKPRRVTIIYLNPVCHETILNNSPFSKVGEFKHCSHIFYLYSNIA